MIFIADTCVLGVTGTRHHLSREVCDGIQDAIDEIELNYGTIQELHHGDCVGADKTVHYMLMDEFMERNFGNIVVHPPDNESYRAYCEVYENTHAPIGVVLPRKEYLERNWDIVDACDILLAIPDSFEERLRSGTWSTVRAARKLDKDVVLVLPDGSITVEYNSP